MTRKRFIKLIMSYGYQRNEANMFAHVVDFLEQDYKTVYNSLVSWEMYNKEIDYTLRDALFEAFGI